MPQYKTSQTTDRQTDRQTTDRQTTCCTIGSTDSTVGQTPVENSKIVLVNIVVTDLLFVDRMVDLSSAYVF